MKKITNYRGGNLDEKVCKILFKYKGAWTKVVALEGSLNETLDLFEKTDETETVLTYVDFLLQELNSFEKKFKKGGEMSEIEKYRFGLSVYLSTKIGLIDNDENNGMVLFVE